MISFIFVLLASICNAIMDVTQFHFWRSIFNNDLFRARWWNGNVSWRNKYINGDVKQGRTNTPVWFTDAFHFFKSSMIINLTLAIVLYDVMINPLIDFLILGLTWNTFFNLFYRHLLKKQTYEQKKKR